MHDNVKKYIENNPELKKLTIRDRLITRLEQNTGKNESINALCEAVFSGIIKGRKYSAIMGALCRTGSRIFFASGEKENAVFEINTRHFSQASVSRGFMSIKLNFEDEWNIDIFGTNETYHKFIADVYDTVHHDPPDKQEIDDPAVAEIRNIITSFSVSSPSGLFIDSVYKDLMKSVKFTIEKEPTETIWRFLYLISENIYNEISEMDEKEAVSRLREIYAGINTDGGYATIQLLKNAGHSGRAASADALASIYLRSAQWAAKSDNILTEAEIENIKKLASVLHGIGEKEVPAEPADSAPSEIHEEFPLDDEGKETIDDVLAELNQLIGMKNIKEQITTFINLIKVQKERELRGMPVSPTSLHAVFYGPPGTGKTTIARMLGRVYRALDMLTEGHLVETDRAGLVAGYVGQTAIKTDELITKSLNGVLFIDEAYTLAPENSSNDFGREAIDTILKRMEDNRGNLVIIVAGYPDEMKQFIDSNPGLKSRFSRYFYFDHYTPDELLDIFRIFSSKAAYSLSSEAETAVSGIFKTAYESKNKSFGNARFARNLFEKIIEKQANRIAEITPLTDEILSTIKEDDIPSVEELNS